MKDKNETKDTELPKESEKENINPVAEEVSEIDKLKADNEKLRNEYLYLRAEFDNFRKNSIKERSSLIKYGPQRMASSLLNVIDIFDKALEAKVDQENLESFVSGIEMTSNQLRGVLAEYGVKAVESIGKSFDPQIHEALGSEESDEVPEGHILQVFKKPYKFHDKVMRHGQVIIAKSKSNEDIKETSKTNSTQIDDDEIIGFE